MTINKSIFIKLLSIRFAPYFVFGGVLALLIDRYTILSKLQKGFYISMLVGAFLLPQYISDRLTAQKDSIHNFTGSFSPSEMNILHALFIIFVIGVLLSYSSFAKAKRFTKIAFILGGITYPLYLLHWKIGDTIISHMGYIYGTIVPASVVFAILLVSLSYILAYYDIRLRKFLKSKIVKI